MRVTWRLYKETNEETLEGVKSNWVDCYTYKPWNVLWESLKWLHLRLAGTERGHAELCTSLVMHYPFKFELVESRIKDFSHYTCLSLVFTGASPYEMCPLKERSALVKTKILSVSCSTLPVCYGVIVICKALCLGLAHSLVCTAPMKMINHHCCLINESVSEMSSAIDQMINQQVTLGSLTLYHVLSLHLFLLETWVLIPSETLTADLNHHFSKCPFISFSFCHSLLATFFWDVSYFKICFHCNFYCLHHGLLPSKPAFSPVVTYVFPDWFPISFIASIFSVVVH